GTLVGNQSAQVFIFVPYTSCPTSADLNFIGEGSNTATVPWSCSTPTLYTSPDSINVPASPACSYSAGSSGGWTCKVTLSLEERGAPPVNWDTDGSEGIQYTPSSGTLAGNQQ